MVAYWICTMRGLFKKILSTWILDLIKLIFYVYVQLTDLKPPIFAPFSGNNDLSGTTDPCPIPTPQARVSDDAIYVEVVVLIGNKKLTDYIDIK